MRGVEVVIVIPDVREARIAGTQLAAEAKPEGYVVEVYCWGWGRRPDGSVEVDLRGTIRSPVSPPDRKGRGALQMARGGAEGAANGAGRR